MIVRFGIVCGVAAMFACAGAAVAQPAAAPVAPVDLAGTAWTFYDDNGASFTVRFEPKGMVGGTMFSPSWKWSQDGGIVALEYANRLGARAKREGHLLSKTEMAGTARSTRGTTWTWTATRLR